MRDQTGTGMARFAHADDTAAAHVHAGSADLLQRVETVLIITGGDDLTIEFRCRVEVVVVVIETSLPELLSLPRFQHPQCSAGFKPQRFYCTDHFRYFVDIALFGSAPCCAHAEARCSLRFCRLRCGNHFRERQHVLIFNAGMVARCLRAIATVLGTAASLDRNQCGQLHCVGIVVLAVNQLSSVNQVAER